MKKGKIEIFRGALARFVKSQWSSFDLGVYKVNAIPETQVMNTHMDQWGFQGSPYCGKYWELYFKGSSCEIWQISMEFLCFRGHSILWGIITFLREPLRDLGKSQWSSLIWGVYEGITARFGKISMEFLYLGVYKGIKQLSQRCR